MLTSLKRNAPISRTWNDVAAVWRDVHISPNRTSVKRQVRLGVFGLELRSEVLTESRLLPIESVLFIHAHDKVLDTHLRRVRVCGAYHPPGGIPQTYVLSFDATLEDAQAYVGRFAEASKRVFEYYTQARAYMSVDPMSKEVSAVSERVNAHAAQQRDRPLENEEDAHKCDNEIHDFLTLELQCAQRRLSLWR